MLSLEPAPGVAPTLVIAVGNPSRGDDGLGPLAATRIEALQLTGVEVLTDFQLQVEFALDLLGRTRVVFIDASVALTEPFALTRLAPQRDATYTTHAIAPAAVLFSYRQLLGAEPPAAWLLAVRGESFELGTAVGTQPLADLDAALAHLVPRLAAADLPMA